MDKAQFINKLNTEINNYQQALDRANKAIPQIKEEIKQADFNTSCDLAEKLMDVKTVVRLLKNKIEETKATIQILRDSD